MVYPVTMHTVFQNGTTSQYIWNDRPFFIPDLNAVFVMFYASVNAALYQGYAAFRINDPFNTPPEWNSFLDEQGQTPDLNFPFAWKRSYNLLGTQLSAFYEKVIRSHYCHQKNITTNFIYSKRVLAHLPDCSTIAICNSTNCFYYETQSIDFTLLRKSGITKNMSQHDTWAQEIHGYRQAHYGSTISTSISNMYPFMHVDNSTITSQINQFFTFPGSNESFIREKGLFAPEGHRGRTYYKPQSLLEAVRSAKILNEFSLNCSAENASHFIVELNGPLPEGCSYLSIFNDTHILTLTLLSNFYAQRYTRRLQYCTQQKLDARVRRAAIDASNSTANNHNRNSGLLRFNLPGYRYCGPGTNLEKMYDLGGPINALDLACREHDKAYLLGVPPETADNELLEKVQKLRPDLFILFSLVMKSKSIFESTVDKRYTSSLYYIPFEFSPSLTLFFARFSSFEDEGISTSRGADLEKQWMQLVTDLWQGVCHTAELYPSFPSFYLNGSLPINAESNIPVSTSNIHTTTSQPIDTRVCADSGNAEEASGPQPESTDDDTTGRTPAQTPEIPRRGGFEIDGQLLSKTNLEYPQPPAAFGKCRLLISELVTETSAQQSFLEYEMLCPSKRRSKHKNLSGFLTIFLESGDIPKIIGTIDHSNKELVEVVETTSSGNQVTRKYFVVGGGGTQTNQQISRGMFADQYNLAIPSAQSRTIFVILIYIPSYMKHIPTARKFWLPINNNGVYEPKPLTEDHEGLITKYLQDSLLIGQPCNFDECGMFLKWAIVESLVGEDNLIYPIPDVEGAVKPYQSLSRCSSTMLPMQMNDFVVATPTPSAENNCPRDTPVSFQSPFNFRGRALQSTAQQIIINVKYFFDRATANSELLVGSPSKLASLATNVKLWTVSRVVVAHRNNVQIQTPGKKRPREMRTFKLLDQFKLDILKAMIQKHFQNNRVAFLEEIYNEFMARMKDDDDVLERTSSEPITRFKCSLYTFKKLMHKIAYKFGTVDLRVAILQREDIIRWRGRFLKRLRENERDPNKKKIIYTDETWVDPHARTGKAWVPRTFRSWQERKLYTFKQNKIGRGPRLIVLNAENVDGPTYLAWFRKLLTSLEGKGSFLIIVDNAPYHGSAEVPVSRDKKGVMYTWLTNHWDPSRGPIKPEKQYLKWELWDIIKSMKVGNKYYVIDKLAKEAGHEILRLPPYNCDLSAIEYVWKDTKDYIRKNNLDQNLSTVQRTAEEVMRNYNTSYRIAHVNHVKRLGEEYWTNDRFYEDLIDSLPTERLIINPGQIDDEDDEDFEYDEVFPDLEESMTIQSMVHDYENMGLSTMYGYTDEDELEIETAVETPLEDPSSRRQLFVHSTDDDETSTIPHVRSPHNELRIE
ncbi:uncharacterized protein LOC118435498 isoform X2 [Folsomia candida]|uniref:uncharacterized protein LOC118435498 isoform X2 n=1 Tax=Folsomia candida TaxID=158441 RepID=UPI00160544B0|nr:uncharacterized protein LOC118435498 isoform X2 [Folsomia candida]